MPKAEPHFDCEALIAEVHKQDIGLRISTNNVGNFKQIVYKYCRKLGIKVHIYSIPGAPKALLLLKTPLDPTQPESANDVENDS